MEGIGGELRKRKSEHEKKRPSVGKNHLPGIEIPEVKKERYIHSQEHALAAEISAHFGEKEKFAAYLSVINRIGVAQARTAFASIKSGDIDVRNPKRFFMWLAKSTQEPKKKPPAKPEEGPGKQLGLFKRIAKNPGK